MPKPEEKLDPPGEEAKMVAKEIWGFVGRLNLLATALQFATVSFALAAIVLSLIVATFTDDKGLPIKFIAFLSAAFTSIYTGFRLRTKAANVRDAHRYLRAEVYRYRAGLIELPDLIDAYSHAEKLVGHVEIDALSERSSTVPGQGSRPADAPVDQQQNNHPAPEQQDTGQPAGDQANH